MDTMAYHPAFIADQMKFLRRYHKMTQDNVATAANLSTRTIEKIESGRHNPEEQTVRSLARAFGLDAKYFVKPTAEEEARTRAEMLRAIRKTVVFPSSRVRTATDIHSALTYRDALCFDVGRVSDDTVLELAAALRDHICDVGDIWDDCSMSQQVAYVESAFALCRQIEEGGYFCCIGRFRQQMRAKDRPRLIFNVLAITILPKKHVDEMRYGVMELEGSWETLEEDRPTIPDLV
jgi:transcriptional regulator with XRE-family HTH domain